jgi:hypothetical protein
VPSIEQLVNDMHTTERELFPNGFQGGAALSQHASSVAAQAAAQAYAQWRRQEQRQAPPAPAPCPPPPAAPRAPTAKRTRPTEPCAVPAPRRGSPAPAGWQHHAAALEAAVPGVSQGSSDSPVAAVRAWLPSAVAALFASPSPCPTDVDQLVWLVGNGGLAGEPGGRA